MIKLMATQMFYYMCLIVPMVMCVVSLPILTLAEYSTTVRNLYYWFTFSFSYFLVGKPIKPVRRQLFDDLIKLEPTTSTGQGLRILEIGPGTGSNFEFYPKNTLLTTIELNPYLELHFSTMSKNYPGLVLERSLIGSAEDMSELETASLDIVVGTHVLCCIRRPEVALKEVFRVLKPGGRYYFLELVEHHDQNSMQAKIQKWYAPIWSKFSLGCKAGHQDVDVLLEQSGFYSINREAVELLELPVTHNLVHFGVAVKSNNGLSTSRVGG